MKTLKRAAQYVGLMTLRGLAWCLWLPTMLAIKLVHFWSIRPLVGDAVRCQTCKASISLLGSWECGRCNYSWYGWYWARCEVCGDVPPFVACGRCGASMMNPLLFG